jgi:hypothetical protein
MVNMLLYIFLLIRFFVLTGVLYCIMTCGLKAGT